MTEQLPGTSGSGSVVLEIGADTGALVLRTPPSMDGREIELSPNGSPDAPLRMDRIGAMNTGDMRTPRPDPGPGEGRDQDLEWLLTRVARGEQGAFEAVYDRLAGPAYGVIRKVVRDPAQSEEVTQEVL